jgi:hypothetical protein
MSSLRSHHETRTLQLDGASITVRVPLVQDQMTRDRWATMVKYGPRPQGEDPAVPRIEHEIDRLYFLGFCKVVSRTVETTGLDFELPHRHCTPEQLLASFEQFIALPDAVVEAWTDLSEELSNVNFDIDTKPPSQLTPEEAADPN